ncbi:MAG: c-type cytochrome [Amphiplicatus sp.]
MRIQLICAIAICAASSAGCVREDEGDDTPTQESLSIAARTPDSAKGRELFVGKGCVICHSVNGVGGKAAPVLDAPIGETVIDPLDFAARIWLGAPAMIELQSVELGYTISLSGDEIAHLAAFAGDVAEQKKFTVDQVPEPMRSSLLDERFWEVEDWDEFLRNGQEGYGEPPAGYPDEAQEGDGGEL